MTTIQIEVCPLGGCLRSIPDDICRDIVVCLVDDLSSFAGQWTDLATDAVLEAIVCGQVSRIDHASIDLGRTTLALYCKGANAQYPRGMQ